MPPSPNSEMLHAALKGMPVAKALLHYSRTLQMKEIPEPGSIEYQSYGKPAYANVSINNPTKTLRRCMGANKNETVRKKEDFSIYFPMIFLKR